jgi:hypothetical protein
VITPLKFTSKLQGREQNLSSQKMWDNNNVGLHTFIHGEKSNFKNTSKLKGTKLVTSKDAGQQQCWDTHLCM